MYKEGGHADSWCDKRMKAKMEKDILLWQPLQEQLKEREEEERGGRRGGELIEVYQH